MQILFHGPRMLALAFWHWLFGVDVGIIPAARVSQIPGHLAVH